MNNTAPPLDLLSEEFAEFALDETEEFGSLEDRTDTPMEANGQAFRAKVLGFGSSYKGQDADHSHPPGTPPAGSCPSCRWADVAILKMTEGTYVLALMGKTEVPGENPRLKIVFTADAAKVFQGLFVPSRGPRSGPTDKKIPMPNAVAFRRAAEVDSALNAVLEINEALVPQPDPEDSYQAF